jgi:hypothetical protein
VVGGGELVSGESDNSEVIRTTKFRFLFLYFGNSILIAGIYVKSQNPRISTSPPCCNYYFTSTYQDRGRIPRQVTLSTFIQCAASLTFYLFVTPHSHTDTRILHSGSYNEASTNFKNSLVFNLESNIFDK